MQLPFSSEQFYRVFSDYNQTLWPAQIVLTALALAAIVFVLRPRPWSGIGVSAILAILWIWLALAYHLAFFSGINPLAYVFAGVSLAGAAVFVWQGLFRHRLRFQWMGGPRAAAGTALIVYALVIYPAWLWLAGHHYPATPTFGLPCPTTIFTIGILAFAAPPYPRSPFIVPVLWCMVGAQAAFLLGVVQDLALIVAGAVGLGLLMRSNGSLAAVNG